LKGCEVQVVIVDDGSSDDTPATISQLRQEFPFLSALHQPNGGLSSARNFGLSHAHGRYVLFLDADDMLLPCDVSSLTASDCHMVRFGVEETSDTAQPIIRAEPKRRLSGREYLVDSFRNNSFYTSSCAYLYKLEWLREENLSFPEGILHEDNLFTVQALLKAETVLVMPTLLYRYMRRPESITTSLGNDKLLPRIRSYTRIAALLTAMGNEDPSFDLRWKIQEVLDGAQRLANSCSSRAGHWIALQGLLKFMFMYRGYGAHALRAAQLNRVLRYLRCMAAHR